MILVHVKKTWPQHLGGQLTAEESVLGDWAPIARAALEEYGDVLGAVHENVIVAVYDIDPDATTFVDKNTVRFAGVPSTRWAHLIGQPNPGRAWGRRGYARNVQYLDTAVVAGGDVTAHPTPEGRRAVVGGFTLTVTDDGNAVVLVPADRTLTVKPVPGPVGEPSAESPS